MRLSIRDVQQYVLDMEFRMPFHFANTTVTGLPHMFLAVELELEPDGETHTGVAAEGLSPAWFVKDPDVSYDEGLDWMFEVIDHACEIGRDVEADTVFEFWHQLFQEQEAWAEDEPYPPLLWSFGASMVERAVVDAFCRGTGTRFVDAVHENDLGIELDAIYDELSGYEPSDLLPEEPLESATLRHTVGFTDPLTDEDIEPDERLDDGLPQSLTEYIRTQDLRHFKLKLSGDEERDATRLKAIRAVLEEECDAGYAFTVDANEQYGTASEFKRQWETLREDPELATFFEHLMYVEQPLARDEALGGDTTDVFAGWSDGPPVIIDESDGRIRDFGRALDCGYEGTSHKNCKGVFRGLVNACLAEHRRREDPSGEYTVSGEDLTVVGPVCLPADLAVMATIGAESIERNGHHYFRGVSMLPESLQEALVEKHGDLYEWRDEGYAAVAVEDGEIELGSVVRAPFGYDVDLDFDLFSPVSESEHADR